MKLSGRTSQILKNYSRIVGDKGIVVETGTQLTAISTCRKVIARANVVEDFPVRFAVGNVGELVGALSLFASAELEFKETMMVISEGNKKVVFAYTDPDMVSANSINPSFWTKIPAGDIPFKLSKTSLSDVLKAAGTLGLPEISIIGADGKITVAAVNSRKPLSNSYTAEVGETDKAFRFFFTAENWAQLLVQDYDVAVIGAKRIAHFNGGDAEYWLSAEENSEVAQ